MTTVSLPYQVGAAEAPIDPSPLILIPMLLDAIRKRLQPRESSLSKRVRCHAASALREQPRDLYCPARP